jgi:hypothetical protein
MMDRGRKIPHLLVEGKKWAIASSSKPFAYQIHKQDAAYFLTMTAVEWVEVFSRREAKQLICDSLNHCIEQRGWKCSPM